MNMSTTTNTMRPTEFRAMQKGEVPAPSNKTKKNTRKVNDKVDPNVNAVVDHAFVPDMQDKAMPETIRNTETMQEDAFWASVSGNVVNSPVWATPANGEHSVIIYERQFAKASGTNPPRFYITFRDVEKNIQWRMKLLCSDVCQFLNEVSAYNNGIGYGLEPQKVMGKLEKVAFKVWVQNFTTDKGENVYKTYANRDKYENFARFLASQQTK
jgi:hypothetical protein